MRQKIFYISLAMLAALVIYAFSFVGSPAHNRRLLEDRARLNHLNSIGCVIAKYYRHNGVLPQNLSQAESHVEKLWEQSFGDPYSADCHCYVDKEVEFKDPVSGQPYEYVPSKDSYKLCAEFNVDWDELKENQRVSYDWVKPYKAGKACFERSVQKCKKDK